MKKKSNIKDSKENYSILGLNKENLNIELFGVGNIILNNITDSDITIINKIILSSNEYKNLNEKIEQAKELLKLLPKSNLEARLKQQNIIKDATSKISKIENEAFNIYNLVIELPQNSVKLKKAKQAIENGNLEIALNILNSEELEQEQSKFLNAKNRQEKESRKTNNKLKTNAHEYLLKARLLLFSFDSQIKSNEIQGLFESSIKSYEFFNNLFDYARFLQTQKDLELAKKKYKQALKIVRLNIHKSKIYNNLGNLYNAQNNKKKSIDCFENAISLGLKASKNNPKYKITICLSLDSLGKLYLEQHNFERSEYLFKSSLNIRSEFIEEPDKLYLPDLTSSLLNLAKLYFRLGNFVKTNEYLLLAEANTEEYKDKYPYYYKVDIIQIYRLKGNLNLEDENVEQSKDYYNRAKKIAKKLLDNDYLTHIDKYTDIIIDLGNTSATERNTKSALRYYQSALNIVKKLSKVNPESYIPIQARIEKIKGISYYKLNLFQEAYKYLKDAVNIFEKYCKQYSNRFINELITIYALLGSTNDKLKNFSESEKYYLKAIAIYKKLIKSSDNSYMLLLSDMYYNLANLYARYGNESKANKFCQLSIDIIEESSDETKNLFLFDVASHLCKIANFFAAQGADEKAIYYYDKSLDCYGKLANNAPMIHLIDVASIYLNMYIIFNSNRLSEQAESCYLNLINFIKLRVLIKYFTKRQLLEFKDFLNFCIKYFNESNKSEKAELIIDTVQKNQNNKL